MLGKIEKIFKALGDKNRLRIINMLVEKPLCVCEITEVLQLSQSTVSGHLRILKEAELVEDEKDGLWVEYRLCEDNRFNSDILKLIRETLKADRKMEAERKLAGQANREVICRR
jgi:ArsR family transcriptional regulator, arsenate/arsenite/antimonite-responsive transcriptional repressor